jgi:hypothetical protein
VGAAYQIPRKEANTGQIIDKTKAKIKLFVGDLTGDERLKREDERDERQDKSNARVW